MCQVHTGAYVSLLTPGKTDYTACHPGKTPTYILHVVPIITHTHIRRKSIRKSNKEKKRRERKGKKKKESEKGQERKKRQEKQEETRQEEARKGKKKLHISRP